MYFRGFIRFKVNGLNLGALIERLAKKGVTLYGIKKSESRLLEFSVRCVDAQKVIALLENLCYNYSAAPAKGFLPFIKSLYKRTGLLAGIALIIFALAASNFFVWEIRVSGCDQLAPQTVVASVKEAGTSERSFGRASSKDIEKMLLTSYDNISFASAKYKGLVLYIEIVETPPPPQVIDTRPCDIVSKYDGVISKLLVYQGTALVKAGDTVTKGQVLIAGYFEKTDGERLPVRAMGEAYGIASVTYTQTFYCKRQVESTTGRVQTMRHIELFGMSFPAKPAKPKFDTYKEIIEYSYIFYNNFIPARLVTVKHYQTEIITETQDFEKVKKIILEEAEKQAESQVAGEGKVTKTQTNVIDKGDIKYIQTTVEVEKSFL